MLLILGNRNLSLVKKDTTNLPWLDKLIIYKENNHTTNTIQITHYKRRQHVGVGKSVNFLLFPIDPYQHEKLQMTRFAMLVP